MKAPPLADDVKMEVKRFHDRISASAAAGTRHPVNFDDVWALAGYSRKDSAKRALKGPGIDGEISLHTPVEPITNDKVSPQDCVNKVSSKSISLKPEGKSYRRRDRVADTPEDHPKRILKS